jgi:hypothetical protein
MQTNFGFIVCYDIDNEHIEVKLGGRTLKKMHWAEGGAKIVGVFCMKNHKMFNV